MVVSLHREVALGIKTLKNGVSVAIFSLLKKNLKVGSLCCKTHTGALVKTVLSTNSTQMPWVDWGP